MPFGNPLAYLNIPQPTPEDDLAALAQEQPQLIDPYPEQTQDSAIEQELAKIKEGESVSVSRSGLTPEGKVYARSLGDEKGYIKDANKRFSGYYDALVTPTEQAYNNVKKATLKEGEALSNQALGEAGNVDVARRAAIDAGKTMGYDIDPTVFQGTGADVEAVVKQKVMEDESRLQDSVNALLQKKRMDHEVALAKWQAMGVDPNRLMRGGAGASLILSAGLAATGKPGNIAAANLLGNNLQTLLRNDLEGQIKNLEHGRDVTAGFKAAWDMARQDSETMVEARHKLMTMYLDTASTYLKSVGLQEKSKVIQAQYLKSAAEIDKLKVDQVNKLNTFLIEEYGKAMGEASQRLRTAAQVSAQREAIRLDRDKFRAQEAASLAKHAQDVKLGAILSRNAEGNYTYLGNVDVSTPQGVILRNKINESQNEINFSTDQLTKLQGLVKQRAEANNIADDARRSIVKDNLDKQIDSIAKPIAVSLARAFGAAPISDPDRVAFEQAAGSDSPWQALVSHFGVDTSSEKATSEMIQSILNKGDNMIASHVVPLENPEDLGHIASAYGPGVLKTPTGKASPGTYTGDIQGQMGALREEGGLRPGTKKLQEGIANPPDKSKEEELVNEVGKWKPSSERDVIATYGTSPKYWQEYIDDLPSGLGKGDTEADTFATKSEFLDETSEKGELSKELSRPVVLDPIAKIANKAFYGNDDERAVFLDDLEQMTRYNDIRGRFSKWALRNKDAFKAVNLEYKE